MITVRGTLTVLASCALFSIAVAHPSVTAIDVTSASYGTFASTGPSGGPCETHFTRTNWVMGGGVGYPAPPPPPPTPSEPVHGSGATDGYVQVSDVTVQRLTRDDSPLGGGCGTYPLGSWNSGLTTNATYNGYGPSSTGPVVVELSWTPDTVFAWATATGATFTGYCAVSVGGGPYVFLPLSATTGSCTYITTVSPGWSFSISGGASAAGPSLPTPPVPSLSQHLVVQVRDGADVHDNRFDVELAP